ncbi:MAG: DUF5615 family PIN-like protein [Gemmatimonadetes bacterium]|nr:DUF5615 family PIN-like protein [Gemmatimonadota bacterium]
MSELQFLADMNISPQTVSDLCKCGWDVVRVSDLIPDNSPDEDILELARRRGMVLLTQDLDFSKLIALGGYDSPSLVTLRMSITDPEIITRVLLEVFPNIERALREGFAVTIDDRGARARKLPVE